MARQLTKKQRKFVNEYTEKGNGVEAALASYDTVDYRTANSIAVENLQKPAIKEELRKLGFDSNNAKRVVAEILNDETVEPQHRIKAAENVFKVQGDYAPEKHVNLNLNEVPNDRIRRIADRLLESQRQRAGSGEPTVPDAVDRTE